MKIDDHDLNAQSDNVEPVHIELEGHLRRNRLLEFFFVMLCCWI